MERVFNWCAVCSADCFKLAPSSLTSLDEHNCLLPRVDGLRAGVQTHQGQVHLQEHEMEPHLAALESVRTKKSNSRWLSMSSLVIYLLLSRQLWQQRLSWEWQALKLNQRYVEEQSVLSRIVLDQNSVPYIWSFVSYSFHSKFASIRLPPPFVLPPAADPWRCTWPWDIFLFELLKSHWDTWSEVFSELFFTIFYLYIGLTYFVRVSPDRELLIP